MVYTNHQTLQNFDSQCNLSQCQLHWQECMSQYNLTITYIPGKDNTVADALSQVPDGAFLGEVIGL
jgi:hypothetical protein